MALHGLASLLRRALTYFGEAAVRGDPSGSNVQYLDFSAMSDLVQAAVNGWGSAEPPAKAEIIRLVMDLGAAYAALEGKLTAALSVQRSAEGQRKAAMELLTQLMAALPVLGECCALAVVARLPPEATAQFARCGVLIVGDSSRAVLSNWLKDFAPRMRDPVGPNTPADRLPSTYYNLSTATMQLQAADSLLRLLAECGGSGGLAAFAATVWTPEVVTRWLASILVVVHAGKDAGCHYTSLESLALVCNILLTHSAFGQHQAAIQASPALQSKLAALLPDFARTAAAGLMCAFNGSATATGGSIGGGAASDAAGAAADSSLGALPADSRAAAAQRLAISCLQTVTAPCLEGGVQQLAAPPQQQEQRAQWLQQMADWEAGATALLQAVPAARPASLPVAKFVPLLLQIATSAAHLHSLAASADEEESRAMSQLGERRAMWEIARLPRCTAAASMLPHLAHVLTLLLRDSELAAQLAAQPAARVAAACDRVAAVARQAVRHVGLGDVFGQTGLLDSRGGGTERRVQLLASAAAVAETALRLVHFAAELPLLAAHASRSGGLAAAGVQLAISGVSLAGNCMATLLHVERQLHQASPPEVRAEVQRQQLPAQLRRLHTTACRLVHYVAAAKPEQLEAVPILSTWPLIAACGSMSFRATADLALGPAEGAFDRRDLQAMGAAEVEAQLVGLQVLRSGDVRRNQLAGIDAGSATTLFGGAVECLVQAFALGGVPYGSQAAGRQALEATLSDQLQNFEHGAQNAADNCTFTMRHAARCSQLAVALAASGLLGRILKAGEEQGAAGRMAPDQVAAVRTWAAGILGALPKVARSLAEAPSTSAAAQQAAQRCKAASVDLEAALQSVQHRLPADITVLFPAHLEEPAKALGVALEAWAEVPEQSNEQQLALALAAGTRNCAYLRCANVGASGGPGAGEQEGSSRCSACRAVWYCGTACSHADWRAGHRRTCKALAAARQLTKAAAAGQQRT